MCLNWNLPPKMLEIEVLLSRLCIGHTRFTHGLPLRRNLTLTLFQIFIECPFLEQCRVCLYGNYGYNLTMPSILGELPLGTFFHFFHFSTQLICYIK